MKAITINVQISKCPKQYESIRLGGEWSVEDGETVESAMAKAYEQLNAIYADMLNPKPKTEEKKPEEKKPESGKTPLSFDNDAKTLKQICKRIEDGVKLDKVLEYYEPDEQAMAVLKAAAEFNKDQTAGK